MAASKKDVAKQQVKEDREKVREMYLSGKTVKEIAKETYFSSSYCYAMVRDLAKEKNFAKKAKRAPLDEAMIQDAKAGMTVAEIAKKHGVTYQQCYYTVSEYAQATIKKNKKKQSAATKVRNAAMLEDAKAGMTDKEIAKKYFLSRSSVRTVLAGHLHTNSKKLDERRKAILADYEAGTSSKDICEKYGISKSTLYKDMRQIGKTCQEYYHKALKDKTNQRNSDIRSKIERGVSVSTIAKEYGISKTAIYETFHQENVRAGILQKRGRPRKNTERNALIAKRHREGEKVQALAPTTRYSGILMFVYNLDTIYCVFSLTGYHIYGIIQLFSGRGTAPETSRFSFPQSWSHGFI